jgi:hypothetical protein
MTEAAKKLIDEFDALPESEPDKVLAELLRRVALSQHSAPDDSELLTAADQVFQELDRVEKRS